MLVEYCPEKVLVLTLILMPTIIRETLLYGTYVSFSVDQCLEAHMYFGCQSLSWNRFTQFYNSLLVQLLIFRVLLMRYTFGIIDCVASYRGVGISCGVGISKYTRGDIQFVPPSQILFVEEHSSWINLFV